MNLETLSVASVHVFAFVGIPLKFRGAIWITDASARVDRLTVVQTWLTRLNHINTGHIRPIRSVIVVRRKKPRMGD